MVLHGAQNVHLAQILAEGLHRTVRLVVPLIFEQHQPAQHLTLAVADALVVGVDADPVRLPDFGQGEQQFFVFRGHQVGDLAGCFAVDGKAGSADRHLQRAAFLGGEDKAQGVFHNIGLDRYRTLSLDRQYRAVIR